MNKQKLNTAIEARLLELIPKSENIHDLLNILSYNHYSTRDDFSVEVVEPSEDSEEALEEEPKPKAKAKKKAPKKPTPPKTQEKPEAEISYDEAFEMVKDAYDNATQERKAPANCITDMLKARDCKSVDDIETVEGLLDLRDELNNLNA